MRKGQLTNCDGAGDADDAEGLAGEEGEDAAGEDGGEQDFVDAVGVVGLLEHVQRESEGGEDAGRNLALWSRGGGRYVKAD